jgi:hypothetical protein
LKFDRFINLWREFMSFLTRDQILESPEFVTEPVDVPEWGGDGARVLVKALSSAERDRYEQSIIKTSGKGRKATRELNLINARAKIAVLAMVDEEGKPLFTENDMPLLSRKSGAALGRIAEVAMRLAGLTDEDLDELEGNSESSQADSSVTV